MTPLQQAVQAVQAVIEDHCDKSPYFDDAMSELRNAFAAEQAQAVELPRFPEFNIVVDICKFALRHQDSGMSEAASHQVERLLDALQGRYQPRQHELLAKMWLQTSDDIKAGRRATRLVPSAQPDIPHGTTSKL